MKLASIAIENLFKFFGKEQVLKDISLEFHEGKIYGIVGNNGSGKTVLMKCICGFLQPTEGRVFVEGKQIGKDIDFPDSMGIIIESPGFLPNVSGYKNLEFLANIKRIIGKNEIEEAMKLVGLDPKLTKPVGKYSLGMRQRLGIAQAIMENPKILMLDEPFNGLDKHGVNEMRELLKDQRKMGKTILLASHNQTDIDELCDVVYEIDAGEISLVKKLASV